jgi:hypothetical protein
MIEKLSDLVIEAEKKCGNRRIYNLLLNAVCEIDEIESPFVEMNIEVARSWQANIKPDNLVINHGVYINRHGDGIQHLIDELRNKPDSNRALLSLIDLEDIIRSGDRPIPSFLILQFGFSTSDKKTLYCSAYFRALEVSKFLPINISEICLVTRTLCEKFSEVETLDLTIHAFTAYSNPDFYCLEMSGMDLEDNRGSITASLIEERYKDIVSFLNSKLKSESFIFTDGMSELYNSLNRYSDKYGPEILTTIEKALKKMKELRSIRENASHSQKVTELQSAIHGHISKAKALFEALE